MRAARVLVTMGIVLALLPGTVQAAPAEPPDAHLRYRGEPIQRAFEMGSCWPNEEGLMGCTESSPYDWPAADKVQTGDRVRLRLDWKRKPEKVRIDSYREVRDNGRPKGKGKDIEGKIIPVWRDGKIRSWNVRYRLFGERHHYVKVIVYWKSPGLAVYGSHVKTVD
jgi:hypothetical protein